MAFTSRGVQGALAQVVAYEIDVRSRIEQQAQGVDATRLCCGMQRRRSVVVPRVNVVRRIALQQPCSSVVSPSGEGVSG